MPDKILKPENSPVRVALGRGQKETAVEGKEVLATSQNVVEGLSVLPESSVEAGGQFAEKKEGQTSQPGSIAAKTAASFQPAQITVLPSIDQMILQTEKAIEDELRKTEVEVKVLLKNKKSSVYDINDKIKRIRFLHGLLAELKKAAKVAEEFIVGLWKEFVKKTN